MMVFVIVLDPPIKIACSVRFWASFEMALFCSILKIFLRKKNLSFLSKNGNPNFKGLVSNGLEKKGAVFEIWSSWFFSKTSKIGHFPTKIWRLFYLWFLGVSMMIFLAYHSTRVQNKSIVAPNGAKIKKCATENAWFFEKSWFLK